jgi:hypothetical protein
MTKDRERRNEEGKKNEDGQRRNVDVVKRRQEDEETE